MVVINERNFFFSGGANSVSLSLGADDDVDESSSITVLLISARAL